MTSKRRPIAPAIVVVLTLVVAGCGGQPFPEASSAPPVDTGAAVSPQARLLAAAPRATAAKTSRIALHMTVSGPAEPAVDFAGTGVIDLKSGRMAMSVHETDGSAGDAVDLELRMVGRTEYVLSDGAWTSIPLGSTGLGALVPDPTGYIDFLQGAGADVRVVGHETLRGDATTHYAATLDLARALTRTTTSPAQQSVIRSAVALLGNLHLPVEAWVDGLGRLRKVSLSIDLTSAAKRLGLAASAAPKIDVSIELYDFGVPVEVPVPAGVDDALVRAQDRRAQSDLRNALTAEKVQYTDTQEYTSDSAQLRRIEPSLDWGGRLTVVVGGAARAVVCLSERSATGTTFALADIAVGPNAGTYYGRVGCPAVVNETSLRSFRTGW